MKYIELNNFLYKDLSDKTYLKLQDAQEAPVTEIIFVSSYLSVSVNALKFVSIIALGNSSLVVTSPVLDVTVISPVYARFNESILEVNVDEPIEVFLNVIIDSFELASIEITSSDVDAIKLIKKELTFLESSISSHVLPIKALKIDYLNGDAFEVECIFKNVDMFVESNKTIPCIDITAIFENMVVENEKTIPVIIDIPVL